MRASWTVTRLHRIVSALTAPRRRNLVAPADCLTVGDAVDVATGRVLVSEQDLALPDGLALRRIYSSGWAHRASSLGPGWSHSFDVRLSVERGRVVYRPDDGRELVLDATAEGAVHPLERIRATRVDGGWRVHHGARVLWMRGEHEALLHTLEDGARAFEIAWDGDRVVEVRARHHALRFAYEGARLRRVTLHGPAGRDAVVADFAHDASGALVEARALGERRFTYDYVQRLLVRRGTPSGETRLYGYDGSAAEARCIRTWTRGLRYDDRTLRYGAQTTEVVDGVGGRHAFRHDLLHRPLRADGITLAWDDDQDGVERRGPGRGRARLLADGARVALTRADGTVERATLDATGRVVALEDRAGEAWSMRYDERGRVVERAGPNERAGVRVDDTGPVEITLGDRWVELEHDAGGRLAALVTGEERWSAEYDWLGRADRVVGPGVERRFERDAGGRAIGVVEAGVRSGFGYDARGALVSATLPRGDWSIQRDGGGMPVEVTRPDFAGRLDWDAERRLTAVRDRRERAWTFVRDRAGRVVEERDFDGREYAFQYRGAARAPSLVTTPDGSRLRLRYDDEGRLRRATHGDERIERFEYDAGGRLVAAHRDDHCVRLERGRGGAVVAEQQGEDRVEVRIDLLGRRTMVESSLGARVARTWGAEGERRIEARAFGRASSVVLRDEEVRAGALAVRRAEDRLPRTTGAKGALERDGASRVARWIGGKDRVWTYRHGVDGLVSEVVDPEGVVSRYTYDAFGRRIAVASRASEGREAHERRFVWDAGLALHELSTDAPPTLYVFDPRDGTPVGKIQPHASFWLGLHDDDLVALFEEATGRVQTEVWPWRGGLAVDGRTGLWVGPGIAYHGGAGQPLGFGRLEDELLGATSVAAFAHAPHVARLAERASEAAIGEFLTRLTVPPALRVPDRLEAPFPEPLSFDDLRPRGLRLRPSYAP